MVRHPAVIGSASAVTVLAARAGVEVLRQVVSGGTGATPAAATDRGAAKGAMRAAAKSARKAARRRGSAKRIGPAVVTRRTIVEYVEVWRRPE
jgi:hypothetical protein